MNIQILPHIFKKIGLFLFFLSFINPYTIGFVEGFLGIPCDCENWKTPFWLSVMNSISLLGIMLYFLAKEKIEDELIKRLRLESMSLSFMISLILLLIIQLVGFDSLSEISASVVFYFHLILFLLLYRSKKKNFDL